MRDNNFNQAPRVHIPSDQSHQRRSAATTTASNRLVCLTWLAGYLLTIDTTYLYRLVLSFFIPTNPSRSSNNISNWTDRQTDKHGWLVHLASERVQVLMMSFSLYLYLSLPPCLSIVLQCNYGTRSLLHLIMERLTACPSHHKRIASITVIRGTPHVMIS